MGNTGRWVSGLRRVGGRGAILSPATFFTNICMVSAGSGDADGEIGDEEGMMMVSTESRSCDGAGEISTARR
jgi:hypothetical protein